MGVHPLLKPLLRNYYPAAFEAPAADATFVEVAASAGQHRPPPEATEDPDFNKLPPAQVYLFDGTNRLKYVPKISVRVPDSSTDSGFAWIMRDAQTGREFFEGPLLGDVRCALLHGHTAYLLWDRGSPPVKAREQAKRQSTTVPWPDPAPGAPPVVGEDTLPSSEEWKNFSANARCRTDLLAFLTNAFLDDHVAALSPLASDEERDAAMRRTFTLDPGQMLFIHGGVRTNHTTSTYNSHGRLVLPPVLHFVEQSLQERPGTAGLPVREYVRKVGEVPAPRVTPERVDRLLEGEMAAIHYGSLHPHENCCFVSPDGDMIPQLLLMARDRYDAEHDRFYNEHTLVLRVPGSRNVVIDINQLYRDIATDPRFLTAGINDPVLTFCALAALDRNDFMYGYADGIASLPDPVKNSKMPPSLHVLMTQPELAVGLVRIEQPCERSPHMRQLCVRVDEKRFQAFCEAVYVAKWGKSAAKHKASKNVSPPAEQVRTLLALPGRSARNRMMTRRAMRVIARQLEWVMHYWHNNYRGECNVESPFTTLGGLPYYGWEKTSEGYQNAERVSVPRENPRDVANEALQMNSSSVPAEAAAAALSKMTSRDAMDHDMIAAGAGGPNGEKEEGEPSSDDGISPAVRLFLKRDRETDNIGEEHLAKRARHSLHHSASGIARDMHSALSGSIYGDGDLVSSSSAAGGDNMTSSGGSHDSSSDIVRTHLVVPHH